MQEKTADENDEKSRELLEREARSRERRAKATNRYVAKRRLEDEEYRKKLDAQTAEREDPE